MADGQIVFDATLSTKQLERDLAMAKRKIQTLTMDNQTKNSMIKTLTDQATELGAKLDEAKYKLAEMQGDKTGKYGAAAIAAQVETVDSLQSRWDGVNREIERCRTAIERNNAAISTNEGYVESITQEIAQAGSAAENTADGVRDIGYGAQEADNFLDKLNKRIIGLAKRVFVFSVITSALRKLRQYMSNAIMQNQEAAQSVAQLQGALATLAQPIINAVIPAFTWLVNVITRVVAALASLVSRLFGTTAKESAAAAKALNQQAKGYGGVADAAKKAKREIMGFDELNTIGQDDDSGGSGGGGGSSTAIDFSLPDSDSISGKFEPLAQALERLRAAFAPLLETLRDGGIWIYQNILVPFGEWAATSFLPTFLDLLSNIIIVLNKALEKILPVAQWIWDNILQPIAAWTGGILLDWLGKISGWLEEHGDTFSSVIAVMAGIATGIAVLTHIVPILGAVLGAFAAILTSPITWILAYAWAITELWDKCEGFRVGLTQAWEGVKEFFGGLKDFFVGVFTFNDDLIYDALLRVQEGGKNIIEGLGNGMTAAWVYVKEWISGIWDKLVQGFKDFLGIHSPSTVFEGLGGYIIDGLANGLDISAVWEGIKKFYNETIKPIFTAAYWANVFVSIKEGLIDAVKNGINACIDAFNSFIGWLNEGFHLSYGGMEILGAEIIPAFDTQLFTIPSIPHLAQGAVIPPNREFMAVLGDQKHGTNIEAPLDTIKQAVAEVMNGGELVSILSQLLSVNQQMANGRPIEIDGVKVGEVMSKSVQNVEWMWG